MSRSNHLPGLNGAARKKLFFQVREVGTRILPNGHSEEFDRVVDLPRDDVHVEIIGQIQGAFGAGIIGSLHRYTFIYTGRVYEEYVQVAPWHGGPHYFIALKDKRGRVLKTTVWPRSETGMSEDMNNYGARVDLSHSNS
jgi:hypothetical protein